MPWSKFNKDSFTNSFSQSSFNPLFFFDSNSFLTASNDSLLERFDAVILTKTSSFRLSFSKVAWVDSQYFFAKRAVWKFERLYRADRSTASWNEWQKKLSFYKSFLYTKHFFSSLSP